MVRQTSIYNSGIVVGSKYCIAKAWLLNLSVRGSGRKIFFQYKRLGCFGSRDGIDGWCGAGLAADRETDYGVLG